MLHINKNYFKERKVYSGELDLLLSDHFNLGWNPDYFELSVCISFRFRLITISFFNLRLTFF